MEPSHDDKELVLAALTHRGTLIRTPQSGPLHAHPAWMNTWREKLAGLWVAGAPEEKLCPVARTSAIGNFKNWTVFEKIKMEAAGYASCELGTIRYLP